MNINKTSSIFMTHQENPYSSSDMDELSISKNILDDMIPKVAKNEPDSNMTNTHTEWRWRIFKFKKSNNVEISKKEPNEKRLFKNRCNQWVTYDNKDYDEKFKQYLVKSYYIYTQE
jgi:hypothetical protein